MATETLKSAVLTDLDATPRVNQNRLENGGVVRAAFDTDEVGGAAATGSTYRLIRLKGTDRISRVEFACDNIGGTASTVDIGLYDVTDDAVEDADFFASAVAVASAVARTDVTYESGIVDIINGGKALWEQLGLTDTPENRAKEFDILVTVGGAALDAAGTIAVWAEFVTYR